MCLYSSDLPKQQVCIISLDENRMKVAFTKVAIKTEASETANKNSKTVSTNMVIPMHEGKNDKM